MSRILVAVAAAMLFLSSGMELARADVADMMRELSSLKAEQEGLLQNLNESLALKRQNEAKLKVLDQENERLNIERSGIEAQRPNVERLCTGTYPPEQYQAALARCNSVLAPFTARVNQYNGSLEKLNAAYAVVEQAERERAAKARVAYERYERNKQRMATLAKIIAASAPGQCVISRHCGDMTGEAAVACLMCCWDGAKCDSTASRASTPAPAFEAEKISSAAGAAPSKLRSINVIKPALSQSR